MSIGHGNRTKLSELCERRLIRSAASLASCVGIALLGMSASGCGSDGLASVGPDTVVEVSSITIETGNFAIERGFHQLLKATVKDNKGKTITVPLVWRSSDEKIATLDPAGRLTALDTGITTITASSLGVTSQSVGVKVVFASAAKLAPFQWTPPNAASPNAVVNDSIRVVTTDIAGGPAAGAIVKFAVTGGGGTVSVTTVISDKNGVAATKWTLGPALGTNSVSATVINDDSVPITWVTDNPTKFSVKTYKALIVVGGDAQTGQILDALPVPPSVKLVDSTGKARVGVPLTFSGDQRRTRGLQRRLDRRRRLRVARRLDARGHPGRSIAHRSCRGSDRQPECARHGHADSLHAGAWSSPVVSRPAQSVPTSWQAAGAPNLRLATATLWCTRRRRQPRAIFTSRIWQARSPSSRQTPRAGIFAAFPPTTRSIAGASTRSWIPPRPRRPSSSSRHNYQ